MLKRMCAFLCAGILLISLLPLCASAGEIPSGLNPPYTQGNSGKAIVTIKTRMMELGYYKKGASMSKEFNSVMKERVVLFQTNNGMAPTGVIDSSFLEALYSDSAVPSDMFGSPASTEQAEPAVTPSPDLPEPPSGPESTPSPTATVKPSAAVSGAERFVRITPTPRPAGPTPTANRKRFGVLFEMEARARYIDGTFRDMIHYYNQEDNTFRTVTRDKLIDTIVAEIEQTGELKDYAGSWEYQKRRATSQLLRFREVTLERGNVVFIYTFANIANPNDENYIPYYSLKLDENNRFTVLIDQITGDTEYTPVK